MTSSKIIFYLCLSFIAGIFLNSFFAPPIIFLWLGLILGLIFISLFKFSGKFVIFGFFLLFLILGIWRHQSAESGITDAELRVFNNREKVISLIGIIAKEPDFGEKSQKLTLKLETEDGSPLVEGKVLIMTRRSPQYQYGDKLKITGRLEIPSEDIQGFNYKNYLRKDGIYSTVVFPQIQLIGSGFGSPLMKFIFSLKNKFKEISRRLISPPQEGILEALTFGDEDELSKDWKDKLNFTGTRHITAVSGMNITIIAFLITSFVLGFGFWRKQAILISLFLLSLYILMVGAPASALRAGIMAGLVLIGQYFGRFSCSSRPVFFAAAIMLFQNPLLLKLDVGFHLSFLAILGIIYLQPIISNFLKMAPNPENFPLRTALSATLAAQIFTLPILIYNFGYIPLSSPLINILVVPFLAPLTILIFIFGLSAVLFLPLGYLLSWLVWLSLSYILFLIDWFSKFPFASLSFQNTHWLFLPISYLFLGFIVWRLQESQKLKFLKY